MHTPNLQSEILGSPEDGQKEKRPQSNWAQITSAVATVFTLLLAVWALFFSPASQTIVDFLQSELTIRNSKISELEKTADNLRNEIEVRENRLVSLSQEIEKSTNESKRLAKENSVLSVRKKELESEVAAQVEELENYTKSYEALRIRFIASKLYAMMRGALVSVDKFRTTGVEDIPEMKINVWSDYTTFAQASLAKLKGEERKIGAEVIRRFLRKCERLGDRTIAIGPLKAPKSPYNTDIFLVSSTEEQNRLSKNYKNQLENFQKETGKLFNRILKVEEAVEECMQSID
jgi:hypothetical protein